MGLAVLLFLGLAAAICLWLTRPVPRVTPDTFHRLRLGMTLAQVEHRLGPPSRPGTIDYALVWEGEGIRVTLDFTEPHGRGQLMTGNMTFLDSGALKPILPPPRLFGEQEENFIDRLHDWLGW
jgi:hypothetical protein